MEKLRIVFMGTPEFAVGILDTIIKNNYEVVGVITAADKPAGRGQKLKYSAVKEYALEHNLTLLQPTNLKDEDFKKGFTRNPFLEKTITTPIHIPETFTNNQTLELAKKIIKIQKTKAGNMLNGKGKREYSDAAADIDVLCMTYLDDPVDLSSVSSKPLVVKC